MIVTWGIINMTPEQENTLLTSVTEIHTKMDLLITNGGSKGMVPDLQKEVKKHEAQISFWRGAIAVIGTTLMLLATAFAGHIWGSH